MKFRGKPVVVEAFRYNVDPRPDWFMDKVSDLSIITHESFCQIMTPEGEMRAEKGDWVVQDVMGEVYPVRPDIFNATYEPLAQEEASRA